MTEKQIPFAETPDPKIIPELLTDHEAAEIVRSMLHREEAAYKNRSAKRRKKAAGATTRRNAAKVLTKGVAAGTAVGLGVGIIGPAIKHKLEQGGKMSSEPTPGYVHVKEVVAKPGDTLWGIVDNANLGGDIREGVYYAEQSMKEQGLGEVLQPGETVVLPAGAATGNEGVMPAEMVDHLPQVYPEPPPPNGNFGPPPEPQG